MILRVLSYPNGPRVWVLNQRAHHGATGALLATGLVLARHRRMALLGLLMCAHDRRDWRVWFARERCPK